MRPISLSLSLSLYVKDASLSFQSTSLLGVKTEQVHFSSSVSIPFLSSHIKTRLELETECSSFLLPMKINLCENFRLCLKIEIEDFFSCAEMTMNP